MPDRSTWRRQKHPCATCGAPCNGRQCRRCYLRTLPGPGPSRAYTWRERQRRKRVVDEWITEYGWTCPGFNRSQHAVEPGPRQLTADHVVPVGAGGAEDGPLSVLCNPCNSGKRDGRPPGRPGGRAGTYATRRTPPAVAAPAPRSAPGVPSRIPDTSREVTVSTKPATRRLAAAPEPVDEPIAPPPPAPEGAGARGLRLWTDITGEYDLAAHELVGLEEMVRIADTLDELYRIVQDEGLMVAVLPAGRKVNPAAVEARQLRIVFARIAAALRLPSGDEDGAEAVSGRPQKRGGARGVYGIRGAV